jgi:23S rRNA pseudouridine2605 synthase
MRLNVYIAQATGLSRRAADKAIAESRVRVNGELPSSGQKVTPEDIVSLDGQKLITPEKLTTIMLNKPVGYVCSRAGQGSQTIYDLLPPQFHGLKPIGRLDKNSSGLLLLTNDGILANNLTHPSHQKVKVYDVRLNKPLLPLHQQLISDHGIKLDDGNSKFLIEKENNILHVTMREGRNRQIRRTFESLGYSVNYLHRTQFGPYSLGNLSSGQLTTI